jgi:hypothetical protein
MRYPDVYGFADSVIAPIVAGYLARVQEVAQESERAKVFFLAREGWYLKKYWDSWNRNFANSEYLYCNRIIVNRAINIHSENTISNISSGFYTGELGEFLNARLSLDSVSCQYILEKLVLSPRITINLPEDRQFINGLIRSIYLDHTQNQQFVVSRANYLQYLQTTIAESEAIFCDVGFSGSASKAISGLINNRITNVFFQHYAEPKDLVSIPNNLQFVSTFARSASDEMESAIFKLSILFESIFRAPENLAVDIGSNGNVRFRNESDVTPQHLKAIDELHNLAAPSVAKLLGSNLQPYELVQLGSEAIDILFLRVPLIPEKLLTNLYLADDYCGKKPLEVFHKFS